MTWEQRVRRRAEGLRRAANLMISAHSRAIFLGVADDYDCLADQVLAQLTPAAVAASLSMLAGHQGASERWAGLGDQ